MNLAQIGEAVKRVAQDPGLLRRLTNLYRKRKRYNVDWTQGGCLTFAVALQRILGGQPIYVWIDAEDGDDFTTHIGILLPDVGQLVLDADGFTPVKEWANRHRFWAEQLSEEEDDTYSVVVGKWPPDRRELFYDSRLATSIAERLRVALGG